MSVSMRNVFWAVLGGTLVAAVLWAAGGGPGTAEAESGADHGPDATDVRAATTGRQAPAFRSVRGTVRIVARARDVAGGPDWVVERFVLRGRPFAPYVRVPKGPVECVRLGRAVGRRVAWLDALGRAGRVSDERRPTFCTVDGRGRDLQTLAVLDARGGRVRRTALVTFGFGRRGRRAVVHGRTVTLPRHASGFVRVDRPVAGETPVNARPPMRARVTYASRGRMQRQASGLPDVTTDVRHPRVISQSGTPIGTVGVVVGRMGGTGEPCVASGVVPAFMGTAGRLRGPLGVIEVDALHQCDRIGRHPRSTRPLASVGALRVPDAAGGTAIYSTAVVLAPRGVDRIELRTVGGVQTVRVAEPGVALAIWPDSGAGTDDFGPNVDAVGLGHDGRRVVARNRYREPSPPTGDVAFGG
ncbi:hypothetical protein [Patulibacter americanus]|uniref:hypothetical protein n=1 Tax=Patulibacter americanus TaxID=588672 RepID=UPI0012FCB514|nr:hypothetical protein [Patulibacter americanus]